MTLPSFDIPWFKLLIVVALIAFVSFGGIGKMRGLADGEVSSGQIAALATQVKPGEVVVYTINDCLYCKLAKEWLDQHKVAYTECNISVDSACSEAFNGYGAHGTPFLVVRGQQMHEGFQTGVFLKLLRQTSS
ncbi:glutaredoxin family protein [Pseudoduganella sp. LjRoot289]|uniref:glutaredoxin family protein n=1 Tax=Pseudoduganella sp. LjRoot289 TaxID=3342314 RepID=UPI003ECFD8DB